MKQKLKESFDQIHAPVELIEDTKRMIHESNSELGLHKDRNTYRNKVVGLLVAVASIAIVTTSIYFFNKGENSKTTQFQQDHVNLGKNGEKEENIFRVVKSEAQWKAYIQDITLNEKQEMKLDDDYIVYSFPVERNQDEYTIQIQVKNGTLRSMDSTVSLIGEFNCVILLGEKIVNQSSLGILTSSQFINTEDVNINRVGTNDVVFELDTIGEDGLVTKNRYTVSSDWSVTKESE